ncbi:cation:proton antiporter [Marinospirillum alkaliphilum]|uniref:Multicomponent Na+:H+ antiporter subunit F n=1 Tax=Marinospirillum alkaliphilum DSM 21637 TaxID=1122209 RepID=A0A1K1ZG13_9GAMM|nr:cation:proton antiporter [Marinospirillum alkaliphilum]SFX73024.1 multicomponent Na+:H+ antiporter subunit F [Marinospirillum alkaliphilum DSM 21637]
MSLAAYITLIMMSLALVVVFIRLVKGPTLPDRVVALELMASIMVGMIGVHAIYTNSSSFIDVAIVMALTAFLAAIGFARFLERGGPRHD